MVSFINFVAVFNPGHKGKCSIALRVLIYFLLCRFNLLVIKPLILVIEGFLLSSLIIFRWTVVEPRFNEPLYNEDLGIYNERFSSARPKLLTVKCMEQNLDLTKSSL